MAKLEEFEPIKGIEEAASTVAGEPIKAVEFEPVGLAKPPDFLDFIKEPINLGRSALAGPPGAVLWVEKNISNISPEVRESFAQQTLEREQAVEYWRPKTPSPFGEKGEYARRAVESFTQSTTAGLLGAGVAMSAGLTGLAAGITGLIISSGLLAGGANWYDLTEELRSKAIGAGATSEEIEEIQRNARGWKMASASSEVAGEVIPGLVTAGVFGLLSSKTIKPVVKEAIRTTIFKFAKKYGWAQLSEGLGEQFTAAVQYKANEALEIKQDPWAKQAEETLWVAGFQSLIGSSVAHVAQTSRGKSKDAAKTQMKTIVQHALREAGYDEGQANLLADFAVNKVNKVDAVDNAITALDKRAAIRAKPKEERKEISKKKIIEEGKKALATVLAPEAPPVAEVETETERTQFIPEEIVEAAKKAPRALPVLVLQDGTMIAGEVGQQHFEVAEQKNVPFENVVERGFVNAFGEYTNPGNLGGFKSPREEKLAKLRGEKVEVPAPVPAPVIESPVPVKQDVVFIRLEPSEDVDTPHIMVNDQSGRPTVFNPELHNLINKQEAKNAIEKWTPQTEVRGARESRLQKLRNIIRKENLELVPEEITEKSSEEITVDTLPEDVVRIVRRERPGLVEHVTTMSRKGWAVEDFMDDPDFKVDILGLVPEELYFDVLMSIKEQTGSETSVDIWEKMNRDTLKRLDQDLAEIDRMRDEGAMQDLPKEEDNFGKYEIEMLIEKDRVADAIEKDYETPEVAKEIPKVPPVADKPALKNKEVEGDTVWYQNKTEAAMQNEALKSVKLDWNSDPNQLLHAFRTKINMAYHTGSSVPFDALDKLTGNLGAFKASLSIAEFESFKNALGGLKRFALKVDATSRIEPAKGWEVVEGELSPERVAFNELSWEMLSRINSGDLNNGAKLVDFIIEHLDEAPGHIKPLAAALKANLNTTSILEAVKAEVSESPYAAFYDPAVNTIGFSTDFRTKMAGSPASLPEVIIHEVMHSLVSHVIKRSTSLSMELDELRQLALVGVNPLDAAIIKRIGSGAEFHTKPIELWGFADVRKANNGVYYGLLDNSELLAEAFTNPEVQDFLASIPAKPTIEGKPQTILDKFIQFITKIVYARPTGDAENSVLEKVLRVGAQAIEISTIDSAAAAHRDFIDKIAKTKIDIEVFPMHRGTVISQTLENAPLQGTGKQAGLQSFVAQQIHIVEKPPDISKLAVLASSPLVALKDHPEAQKLATKAIGAVGLWNYKRSIGFMEIDNIVKYLNDKQRVEVSSVLKEIESGEVVNIRKLAPEVQDAILATRKFLDSYEKRYKAHLRSMLIDRLNTTEANIFSDIMISGLDPITAVKKWNKYARWFNRDMKNRGGEERLGTTTYADINKYLKEYKGISDWGIKDYITHAMRGSIAIYDDAGRIISMAETRKGAVDEAMRYLKEHPDVKEMVVDTTYRLEQEARTLVSEKYYRVLKGRLGKMVNQVADELNKDAKDRIKAELPGRGIMIRPKEVWSPFVQERKEILPGEKDVFEILPLYVHSIEKKMALDSYVKELRRDLTKFPPNVRDMLERQLDAIRGQYTVGDAIVDDLLARLGVDTSFAYSRTLGAARTVLTNFKLGYRPIAGIINLLSGMGHTWIKTGMPEMLKAARELKTPEGKAFIAKHAPDLGIAIIEGMGGSLKSRLGWYSPMKVFQAPEIPNRELSFMTSFLIARDQLGYDQETAIEFAKRAVDLQQFNYSVAALPDILRSPTGKTIGQFRAYLMKEIEFIRSLKGPAQWAKYLTMQAVLGGPRGFMITLKSLPVLLLINGEEWLDEMDRWLNNNYPKLSRGVFGFFGIDASAPATFQFPNTFEDWAGILLSDIIKFGRDIATPLVNHESYIWEDVKKYTKGIIPIARYWSDIWSSIENEGWILDDKGNNKYKVEGWEDLTKMAIGAKPLKMSAQELEVRIATELERKEQAQANKIVEQFVKNARYLDTDIVTEQLVTEVATHAINPETILAAIERSHLDPMTRQLLRTKMARRMEMWQNQLPTRELIER